ncbi:MAG TPA: hypothetical protein VGM90_06080 [Kofleriaceae bacterium]|jgi:hypothetical protein
MRQTARIAAVHAALFLALWLASIVFYAAVFATTPTQPLWFGVDVALIGGMLALVYVRREDVGFRSLGPDRFLRIAIISVVAIAAVWLCQRLIPDSNMVALDESNYLMTLREQRIIPDGLLPFNIRWLVPFFAGRWNMLPVADMEAVKAINFGAFVIATAGLMLLLVRLRVRFWLALTLPLFLLSSYFGTYGATNRLVLDPANYALYVLMFHCLLRDEHWPLFSITLFIDALNAEKAVYWIPLFVFVTLLRAGPPWTRGDLIAIAKRTAICLAPTVIYFIVLWTHLKASRLEANLCFENLHLMSFSNLGGKITPNVQMNNFQTLWMPFGPFTIFALLGFIVNSPRWMKPIVLLLIPIFVQAVIACDTDRMLAYSFAVYLPFGYLYLEKFVADVPRALSIPLIGFVAFFVVFGQYVFPIARELHLKLFLGAQGLRMYISAGEILAVGTIVFVHFTFFAQRRSVAPGEHG